MNDDTNQILREIRDDQRKLLDVLTARAEETKRLQDRAAQIQDKSAKIVGSMQRFVPIALIVVTTLIVYVTSLLFRVMR